jgi:hypothetical protein
MREVTQDYSGAVSTPQSPQDECDLRAIDQIFDVPHATAGLH